ncbi:hypothetical protein BFW01_g8897 [Lasiodiplodia theobromae]|nr:hypothetical protein BFW01_g8897 [Lasiodiplodia theobromae]
MHFFAKLVTALPAIAGVASAAVIPRAVDSDTMVTSLQDLSTKSSDTDTLAQKMSASDFQSGPAVTNSLSDLIKATTKDTSDSAGTQAFADDTAQQAVCDAYDSFVKVQSAMLNTLTGKADVAKQTGSSYSIAAALRVLEGADDTYSFEIIEAVPSCADAVKADKTTLDKAMNDAITAYSS